MRTWQKMYNDLLAMEVYIDTKNTDMAKELKNGQYALVGKIMSGKGGKHFPKKFEIVSVNRSWYDTIDGPVVTYRNTKTGHEHETSLRFFLEYLLEGEVEVVS